MKKVADKMNINIFEVIHAAASKPFGFVPYYPGPGIGGHCIPIDPFYLTWKAREFGLHTRFIELAGEINNSMPNYVINKVVEALNERAKSVKNSKILVLGAAYKKNVDDMRESPSVVLMDLLMKKGAHVDYSDPHVPELPELRFYDLHLTSKEISPAMIASYDCVVIATAHDKFDYEMIKQQAQLIVDTRGIYYQENNDKIVNA
jgi:UDP-N-acetyl-D-glucosamine dehydrogenase